MNLEEKKISKEYIYKGNTINLKLEKVMLPNGKEAEREIVEHPGAVAIVPFISEDKIMILEQYRRAIEEVILEIPAGKIHKGEDLEKCARRELEEETGFKAKEMQYLGKLAMAPGFADEIIYLYSAKGLYKGNISWDEDEFINMKEMSLEEIKKAIKNNTIIDAKTIAAITFIEI